MNPSPVNILIVDDAIIVMSQLSKILQEYYFINNIHFAENAEDGLIELERNHPHILILDINLPGMSGLEMLKKVKTIAQRDLLIIMLTNTSFITYRDECLKLGADYFLDKSRDFILLPDLIDHYIHQKDALNSC